jgi:hypothetical protein
MREHQVAGAQPRAHEDLHLVCTNCKKIRDESGAWNPLESYISQHSEADFTHSVCPTCIKALYPDYKRSE